MSSYDQRIDEVPITGDQTVPDGLIHERSCAFQPRSADLGDCYTRRFSRPFLVNVRRPAPRLNQISLCQSNDEVTYRGRIEYAGVDEGRPWLIDQYPIPRS